MIYIVAILIVLGPLVFIHELGHHIAAKLFGVRVEVFSLGFGKRLFGFKRGGTDYRVSALPFGGYVKMSGENPMEAGSGDPAEFMSHPRWQRFIIALAGPTMNVLLSIAVITVIFMVHFERDYFLDQPAVIGWVERNSPAAKLGIKSGDRIAGVDGVSNPTWQTARDKMLISAGQPLHFTIEHDGQIIEEQVSLKPDEEPMEALGVLPDQRNLIDTIQPNSPAAQAGVQVGDEVLSVDGRKLHSVTELSEYLQQTKEKPVEFSLLRNGRELDLKITPKLLEGVNGTKYRIGVNYRAPFKIESLPLPQAFVMSLEKNKEFSLLIVEVLKKLVRHPVTLKVMAGPVGIAQQSGIALREGPLQFFSLMALISLNLGIFNLLPIPILDGGLILLIVIEGIMRRDIKREIKELVYQAAFVFLVLFAVIVIYNDLTKTALGHFLP